MTLISLYNKFLGIELPKETMTIAYKQKVINKPLIVP